MKPFFFSSFKKPFIILLFFITAIALFGIAHTFSVERDLTQNHRNSLTPASRALLKKIEQPIQLTLYGGDAETEKSANDLVSRIAHIHVPIKIAFYPLDALPDEIKNQYHTSTPLLKIEASNKPQWLSLPSLYLTEEILMQALREKGIEKPFLVFIEGHGERSLFDTSREGLSEFKKQLDESGVSSVSFNLSRGELPENTTTLAIVSPKSAYLPTEIAAIQAALLKGVRLIWLKDPADGESFPSVQRELGLRFEPGTLIDGDGASFDSPHPAIIFIRHYPENPIFQDFKEMTALPWAQSLTLLEGQYGWQRKPLLTTGAGVWHEHHENATQNREPEGPQIVAATFERTRSSSDGLPAVQRILVMGDGDFISNGALLSYANSTLAQHLFDWTLAPNPALSVTHAPAVDRELNFSLFVRLLIDYVFPFGLPILLFGVAFFCHRKRSLA